MSQWDERYADESYAYGTEPNDFLASMAHRIPAGPVLCLADGEGRNGVHLAGLGGYEVTSVDSSGVGVEKTRRLAATRGVSIQAVQADLADYTIEEGAWAGIVSIFCHLPPALRASVHASVVSGLRPGGVFLLEAYTPEQLKLGTGGPPAPGPLMTAAALTSELDGLDFERCTELRRPVVEGRLHTGVAAVVQVVAVRPTTRSPA